MSTTTTSTNVATTEVQQEFSFVLNTNEKSELTMKIKHEATRLASLEAFHAQILELLGKEMFEAKKLGDVKAYFAKDKLKFAQTFIKACGDDGAYILASIYEIVKPEDANTPAANDVDDQQIPKSDSKQPTAEELAAEAAAKAEADHNAMLAQNKERLTQVVAELESEAAKGRSMGTVYDLTVPDFLLINDYPFNRDVMARLKKAHLKGEVSFDLQSEVAVVKLDKERNADLWAIVEEANPNLCSLPYIKLDGHSRACAWSTFDKEGKPNLSYPESLYVKVYQGEQYTDEHIKETVKVFGSSASDLSTAEYTQMANKALGLDDVLESDFARKSWKSAFTFAGCKTEEEGRKLHKDTLIWVDTLGLKNVKGKTAFLSTGIKAAILDSFEEIPVDVEDSTEEEIAENAAEREAVKQFWSDFFLIMKEDHEPSSKQAKALVKFITDSVKIGSNHGQAYDNKLIKEAGKQLKAYVKAAVKAA